MSSLADYLAKNYLTADPQPERPKKKRKKNKHHDNEAGNDGGGGLIIADDDPPSLRNAGAGINDNDEYDENSPFILDPSSSRGMSSGAEFRKTKKSIWKTVGNLTSGGTAAGEGQDEADTILAQAAAETAARQDANEADDAPTIEGDGAIAEDENDAPRMESGARAGLQTAAQTAAMVAAQERKKKAELAAFQASDGAGKEGEGGKGAKQETIYRDASGRIINIAMKRAEARKAAEQAAAEAEAAKQALMGDVQLQQKRERQEELRSARAMPLARTAEDEDLNEELKSRERWNDPAAQFLTTSRSKATSKTGKPLYTGGFAPNRYGIRPGHKWDGVDRSNGFETEWFQARARKERSRNLEYEWQMDE